MKFCSQCDNMYYLRLSDAEEGAPEKLTYYCRHCGNEDSDVESNSGSILSTDINRDTDRYDLAINPYTKLDPTLPRSKTIKCPKAGCHGGEVIFVRYDRRNIKFLYHCTTCSTSWTTAQR